MEKDEDGWFVASYPSLTGCISQGKIEKQALKNMREAIELHIKTLAEDGISFQHNRKNRKEVILSVAI